MSAQAIIDHARELGITLRANGGNLHYAPKSAAPPELIEEMRANKSALLAALSRPEDCIEQRSLLAWAAGMNRLGDLVVLDRVVSYIERPATTVTTKRAGYFAVLYLSWINAGRVSKAPHSCPDPEEERTCPICGPCPVCGPGCAERLEAEGWQALRALRTAVEGTQAKEKEHE